MERDALKAPNGETLLYPILGDPIAFVKSPQQLTSRFTELSHNGICLPMLVHDGDLPDVLDGLEKAANVRGLLITMPHKRTMFGHCATASETSKLLQVVSVVRRNTDGTWHGDMLDGVAFVTAMKKQGARLEDAHALQVGAGSAGSAIAIALLDAGVRELVLHDTDELNLKTLVSLLSGLTRGHVSAGPPDPTGYHLVVNATPMGLSPDDPLPVAAELLRSSMFVGDVIAGHGVTPLLKAAREVGCKTSDGVQMVEAGIDLMTDFFLGT